MNTESLGHFNDSAATSISFSTQRARAHTRLFLMVRAMVCTDSKSPGEIPETDFHYVDPIRSRASAICSFLTLRLAERLFAIT